MKSRGRLIQDIHGAARRPAGKLRGQFDALSFTTRKRRSRLSQAHISQTNIIQCLHLVGNRGNVREEGGGLLYSHIQHIGNAFAFVMDLQGFTIVAFTFTYFTWYINIGQEVHFDFHNTLTFTGFTNSPFDVEGERDTYTAE